MRVSARAVIAIWLVTLAGCASYPVEFTVKVTQRQRVPLSGATEVLVRCYCPKQVAITHSKSVDLVLDVAGTYGSGGYHGKQEKPKSMPRELLTFLVRNEGGRLILESKEFTYVHHAYLLSAATVTVPRDVVVRFEALSRDDLYDRRVE